MNKKVLLVVGVIALGAAIFMYTQKDNGHLTEFRTTWWIPLPIALLCFAAAGRNKK